MAGRIRISFSELCHRGFDDDDEPNAGENMRALLTIIALILLGLGIYESSQAFSFTSRSILVSATVRSIEIRKGPPKPTQNTPVHVSFTLPSGEERSAITHLPLLHAVKEGDSLQLLVDLSDPTNVRLPLLSEIWARPLAYLVCGSVLLVAVIIVPLAMGTKQKSPPASV